MKALGTLLRYRAQTGREHGAAMRELLVTLNAIAKTNTPWREQPLKAAA